MLFRSVQGRRIGNAEIAEVRGLIEGNPLWSRHRISRALAQEWQWYAASGELKDMAARSLLLKLHERGLITLPPRRRAPVTRRLEAGPDLFDSLSPEPVVASLSSLRPLQIQVVGRKQPDYHLFQAIKSLDDLERAAATAGSSAEQSASVQTVPMGC